jgi:hypothetical protein
LTKTQGNQIHVFESHLTGHFNRHSRAQTALKGSFGHIVPYILNQQQHDYSEGGYICSGSESWGSGTGRWKVFSIFLRIKIPSNIKTNMLITYYVCKCVERKMS